MQAYSDPTQESDPTTLPDLEVFYWTDDQALDALSHSAYGFDAEAGYYWWACFPGCLPDGEPMGPFDSEDAALEDARN